MNASRLVATLGGAGAVAGFLIVVVYQLTLPAVEANRAARLDAAVRDVLPGIARYDPLYLHQGALTAALPAGVDGRRLEKAFVGFDASGRRVGFAISAAPPGFQDAIEILVGFDPGTAKTLGLVVLASRETPGLGDKILAMSWLAQFRSALTPLVPVKSGTKASVSDIDMITGATISSKAVITGVNASLERWAPLIKAFVQGGGS
jgi:electron transport complex protein RnfG